MAAFQAMGTSPERRDRLKMLPIGLAMIVAATLKMNVKLIPSYSTQLVREREMVSLNSHLSFLTSTDFVDFLKKGFGCCAELLFFQCILSSMTGDPVE